MNASATGLLVYPSICNRSVGGKLTLAVPGAAAAILGLRQQWQDATSQKLATIRIPAMWCDEVGGLGDWSHGCFRDARD